MLHYMKVLHLARLKNDRIFDFHEPARIRFKQFKEAFISSNDKDESYEFTENESV